jgi:polysaccharide export outer membrane protein
MPFRQQRLFRRGYLATGDTEHYKGKAMIYDGLYLQKRHEAVFAAVLRRGVLRTLIRSQVACVFAVFVLLLGGGCQTASLAPLPEQPTSKTPVTLSPGDVIKLSFPGTTDLDQLQRIRTDGKVSLPLLGEVTASGKTLPSFQSELARLYKPQLRNSEVLVTLESGTATVFVSGFVGKPGKFEFDRPTTVFQAIMEAGGVTEFGSLSNIHLVRTINGEQHTQIINLTSAMSGKTTKANYVKDGDVIYVARSFF